MGTMTDATASLNLRLDTLSDLPEAVQRPNYARADLSPGILHIGVGNFHRAHQAWYLHRLMQQGLARDWAILGAGVRPYDAEMRAKLLAQDGLTTLIELDPAGMSAEVIGPMVDYIPVEDGHGPLIAQMARPEIRIVSLTVTEGGYFLDATTGKFDLNAPDIRHDLAHPDTPKTVFGALVAALDQRRAGGQSPFTVLSCDNLQGNGAILRDCVVTLAAQNDPELARWITETGAFPNSMVDCIVPATTSEVLAIARALGIEDQVPVTHENFRQWVIEDQFCAGRPPFEEVGVVMTDNVHAYETMKLRVLNGGHQLLANVGELLSVPTIAACMQHDQIAGFFESAQTRCITPYVDSVPGVSASDYLALVRTRFANSAIHDTTRRVAFDGSSRHPGFLLPSLRDALSAGGDVDGLALAEAFWARMCAGTREDGTEIAANDPFWPELQAAARTARTDPASWVLQSWLYGDLGQDPRFAECFSNWLALIWEEGCQAALARYLATTP